MGSDAPCIYTHQHPDLDAFISVWAVNEFALGKGISGSETQRRDGSNLYFKPADWDGKGLREQDFAVDMVAGGKGIKGRVDSNGILRSAFADIIQQYASPVNRCVLEPLVRYIDCEDSLGRTEPLLSDVPQQVREMCSAGGLHTVFSGLMQWCGDDMRRLYAELDRIFTGMYWLMRKQYFNRFIVAKIAGEVEMYAGGKIAVVREDVGGLRTYLFRNGVLIVIYTDRCGVGILRSHNIPHIRVDDDRILRVIREAGESGLWFQHEEGWMVANGTRKAPRCGSERTSIRPEDFIGPLTEVLDGA